MLLERCGRSATVMIVPERRWLFNRWRGSRARRSRTRQSNAVQGRCVASRPGADNLASSQPVPKPAAQKAMPATALGDPEAALAQLAADAALAVLKDGLGLVNRVNRSRVDAVRLGHGRLGRSGQKGLT